MKCCKDCRKKPWPYLIVAVISTFAAFLTWLTLGTTDTRAELNLWLSAAAFVLVAAILLTYMLMCMARHCGEDQHEHEAH